MRMRRFFNTSLLTTTLVIGLGAVVWAASNMAEFSPTQDRATDMAVIWSEAKGTITRIG